MAFFCLAETHSQVATAHAHVYMKKGSGKKKMTPAHSNKEERETHKKN